MIFFCQSPKLFYLFLLDKLLVFIAPISIQQLVLILAKIIKGDQLPFSYIGHIFLNKLAYSLYVLLAIRAVGNYRSSHPDFGFFKTSHSFGILQNECIFHIGEFFVLFVVDMFYVIEQEVGLFQKLLQNLIRIASCGIQRRMYAPFLKFIHKLISVFPM